jgi:hypothetical protein
MKRTVLSSVAAGLALVATSAGAETNAHDKVLGLLQSAGAQSYAVEREYGRGLESLYIGYDGDGQALAGAAVRETKTYRTARAVVLVTPAEDGYRIRAADMDDLSVFPGKSRAYVEKALKDISGRLIPNPEAARDLVDGVSGATKYYKAIYVSYSLMASRIIEELSQGPAWERKPLAP